MWAKKKRQGIYDSLNAETKLPYTKLIDLFFFFFTEKELFKEKWDCRIGQKKKNNNKQKLKQKTPKKKKKKTQQKTKPKKRKEGFLTALSKVIKKDSLMSIRKHTNETVGTSIKQNLNPDLAPPEITLYRAF